MPMKYLAGKAQRANKQAGDTIIEVLICIAVVGLALAGGYALSSHSLQTGLDSSQRNAALLAADGQVEFLKNAQANSSNGDTSLLSSYVNAPDNFCIDNTNGQVRTDTSCLATGITMSIIYDDCTGVFTVRPQWASFRGNSLSQTTIYYKLPDNFYSGPRC
jgi:prepilin-type N-terminal cleavage/methylation domain-containing protein